MSMIALVLSPSQAEEGDSMEMVVWNSGGDGMCVCMYGGCVCLVPVAP